MWTSMLLDMAFLSILLLSHRQFWNPAEEKVPWPWNTITILD